MIQSIKRFFVLGVLAAAALRPAGLSATETVVTQGSQFRSAIENAPDGAIITVESTVGRFLVDGPYVIDRNLTIQCPEGNLELDGQHQGRIFEIAAGKEVRLVGIRICNGGADNSPSASLGGAIRNRGRLMIERCYFHDNRVCNTSSTASGGGAIYNDSAAELYVEDSTFEGNGCLSEVRASGGAIHNNNGKVVVNRCSFYRNWVDSFRTNPYGGAIYAYGAKACTVIANSTVTGNTNALYCSQGKLALVHATVIGNKSGGGNCYEGLDAFSMSRLVVASSVVMGNQTLPGGEESGGGNNIYATLTSNGSAGIYFSIIGRINNGDIWSQNFGGQVINSYDPAEYFTSWDNATRLPTLRSKLVHGVPQYYYELRDGVLVGKPLGRTDRWTSFGYAEPDLGQIFPDHEFSPTAVSVLADFDVDRDQLSRDRQSDFAQAQGRSWTVGATQNSVVKLSYNANGGVGSRDDTYGYASPHGDFTPAENVFEKPGCTFQAWTNGYTTVELVPGESYSYSELFDTATDDPALYAGPHVLYAKWTPNTYELAFDANGGKVDASSAVMTFGEALGTLPTPTREGCEFAGWEIGGMVVTASTVCNWTGNQTAIARWTEISRPVDPTPVDPTPEDPTPVDPTPVDPTPVDPAPVGPTPIDPLPVGPATDGVSDPTSSQYDPTSPQFIPPELYQNKAVNNFAGNVQYLGWVRDANGALKGTLLVKAAKEKKKDHTSKLSVSYMPFGGKKTTIKNLSPVNPMVGGKPRVVIPEIGVVTIGDDSFASAGNTVQVGQDFTKSKIKTVKTTATARLANKVGNYTFALGLSGKYAGFTVTVDKKGKGKLAGVLPDGTKVSISSQGVLGDRALAIPFMYAKKGSFGFVFWVYDNGVLGISDLTEFKNAAGQLQTLTWHGISRTHELAGSSHLIVANIGSGVSQAFTLGANGKWVFPKKDANPCSWKMSYKAKDGSAKGQFTVLDANGKKVKYTVSGVVVGHTFYGTAYNKKSGSFPVIAD